MSEGCCGGNCGCGDTGCGTGACGTTSNFVEVVLPKRPIENSDTWKITDGPKAVIFKGTLTHDEVAHTYTLNGKVIEGKLDTDTSYSILGKNDDLVAIGVTLKGFAITYGEGQANDSVLTFGPLFELDWGKKSWPALPWSTPPLPQDTAPPWNPPVSPWWVQPGDNSGTPFFSSGKTTGGCCDA